MKIQKNKNRLVALLATLLLAVGATGCGSVDGGMSTATPLPNPPTVTETAATEPGDGRKGAN